MSFVFDVENDVSRRYIGLNNQPKGDVSDNVDVQLHHPRL